jgi:hypothetical protein
MNAGNSVGMEVLTPLDASTLLPFYDVGRLNRHG